MFYVLLSQFNSSHSFFTAVATRCPSTVRALPQFLESALARNDRFNGTQYQLTLINYSPVLLLSFSVLVSFFPRAGSQLWLISCVLFCLGNMSVLQRSSYYTSVSKLPHANCLLKCLPTVVQLPCTWDTIGMMDQTYSWFCQIQASKKVKSHSSRKVSSHLLTTSLALPTISSSK